MQSAFQAPEEAAPARSSECGSTHKCCEDACKPSTSKFATPWVLPMLKSQFFTTTCAAHAHLKKNECTFFCATCATAPHSLCQHCVAAHAGHELIQIRRYVYCDVIRAVDINPHVDTTGVQNYIINQAKVMFLNHRTHSKPGKSGAPDTCRTCRRHLREGYQFCSLACKVDALMRTDGSAEGAAGASTSSSSDCAGQADAGAVGAAGALVDVSSSSEQQGCESSLSPAGAAEESEDGDVQHNHPAKRPCMDRGMSNASQESLPVLPASPLNQRKPLSRRKQLNPFRSPIV